MNNLFLDLDETLVHTKLRNGVYTVHYRPFVFSFLKFCMQHFRVHIWSAGEENYVHLICNLLINRMESAEIVGIFTREHCSLLEDDPTAEGGDGRSPCKMYYKRFDGLTLPPEYTQENVFLLDDNTITYDANEGNVLLIKPWTNKNDTEDKTLLHAIPILKKFATSEDVHKTIIDLTEKNHEGHEHCKIGECLLSDTAEAYLQDISAWIVEDDL